MLRVLVALRGGDVGPSPAAASLVFLRDALQNVPDEWNAQFTNQVITLESAAVATPAQRATMGQQFDDLLATTGADLERLIRNHPAFGETSEEDDA